MTQFIDNMIANGPIEIVIGQQEIRLNGLDGTFFIIHNARHVVVHYLDHAETGIFGDLNPNHSN